MFYLYFQDQIKTSGNKGLKRKLSMTNRFTKKKKIKIMTPLK